MVLRFCVMGTACTQEPILADPDGTLGTEDMPAYDHLDFEQRRLIGLYLRYLNR